MEAVGIENIHIRGYQDQRIVVQNALHIPKLDRRLLSVPRITSRSLVVNFGATFCWFMRGNKSILKVPRWAKLTSFMKSPNELLS
ncbi:hypothetical protein GN958_ATG10800 [Phytophthora infestans]|uniref:Uncharacterized protein n=1 Tax=Phytophthora infestans TaxID=4787 RepID=A0A8S9UH05_PHYIN|nr:hypothetical protein GN958_ATG10800 [Phytophthora infestans]